MSENGKIEVTITDYAGGKRVSARIPANAPMSQVLPVLVTKLQMPSNNTYALYHMQSGKRLADNATLTSAGVRDRDIIRLVPNVSDSRSFSVSPDGKIQVRITDQSGGKNVNARLPANVPVSQLLQTLVTKLQLPSQQGYYLAHAELGKRLADNATLASARVQDGDTIRVVPDVTAGGGFVVYGYRDVQLLSIALGDGGVAFNYATPDRGALFALFLYSPADAALARFMRDNFMTLHHESGHHFFFFIVEKPTEQAWVDARRQELETLLGSRTVAFRRAWGRVQRSQIQPVDREETLTAIRELLKVNLSQMPCAVFFSSLNEDRVFIVPFARLLGGPVDKATDGDMLTMFRALFDLTAQAAQQPLPERLPALQRAIGDGPVGVAQRDRVFSPIQIAILTATVEATIAAIIQLLLK